MERGENRVGIRYDGVGKREDRREKGEGGFRPRTPRPENENGNFRRNSEGKLELRSEGEFKPRGERTFNPNRTSFRPNNGDSSQVSRPNDKDDDK